MMHRFKTSLVHNREVCLYIDQSQRSINVIMEVENTQIEVTQNPKKRPIKGKKRDAAKKARLSGHVTGKICNCKQFQCFEQVSEIEQSRIITQFNAFPSKNEQDCFLSGLMVIKPVERRRSRKEDKPAFKRDCTCQYFVNKSCNGTFLCESVPDHVKNLDLFCDGCAGQNKNWTMIKFCTTWYTFDAVLI